MSILLEPEDLHQLCLTAAMEQELGSMVVVVDHQAELTPFHMLARREVQ